VLLESGYGPFGTLEGFQQGGMKVNTGRVMTTKCVEVDLHNFSVMLDK
jgi:hypothetical protein